jgi:hypothetical protein
MMMPVVILSSRRVRYLVAPALDGITRVVDGFLGVARYLVALAGTLKPAIVGYPSRLLLDPPFQVIELLVHRTSARAIPCKSS